MVSSQYLSILVQWICGRLRIDQNQYLTQFWKQFTLINESRAYYDVNNVVFQLPKRTKTDSRLNIFVWLNIETLLLEHEQPFIVSRNVFERDTNNIFFSEKFYIGR